MRSALLTAARTFSFFDEQDGDFSLEIRGIAAATSQGRAPHHVEVEPRRDSEEEEEELEKGWQVKDESRGSRSGWSWRGVFCGLL